MAGSGPDQVRERDEQAFNPAALAAARSLRKALEQGLAFDRTDRPADIDAWAEAVLAGRGTLSPERPPAKIGK